MNIKSPTFSVVMTTYDQATELEENLPAFLTQDYAEGFEVIVVDESSTDNTEEVLKLLKNGHPNLYSTFLPKPNRLVVRQKLAYSIGIKAAKQEWVVLTHIHAKPQATDVLRAIAAEMDTDTEVVLGYAGRKRLKLQFFTDIQTPVPYVVKAERKGAKGHQGRCMKYRRGLYDFIIVRKDRAYELLNHFEERPSVLRLLGLRLRIMAGSLIRRPVTLVTDSQTN